MNPDGRQSAVHAVLDPDQPGGAVPADAGGTTVSRCWSSCARRSGWPAAAWANANDAGLLVLRGRASFGLGRRDAGLADLRAAAQCRPDMIAAQYHLGEALLEAGRLEEAREVLTRAEPWHPTTITPRAPPAVGRGREEREEGLPKGRTRRRCAGGRLSSTHARSIISSRAAPRASSAPGSGGSSGRRLALERLDLPSGQVTVSRPGSPPCPGRRGAGGRPTRRSCRPPWRSASASGRPPRATTRAPTTSACSLPTSSTPSQWLPVAGRRCAGPPTGSLRWLTTRSVRPSLSRSPKADAAADRWSARGSTAQPLRGDVLELALPSCSSSTGRCCGVPPCRSGSGWRGRWRRTGPPSRRGRRRGSRCPSRRSSGRGPRCPPSACWKVKRLASRPAVVAVQRVQLVLVVRHPQRRPAAAVVVARVHAHAAVGVALVVAGHAAGQADSSRTDLARLRAVEVQELVHRVVGDVDVRLAVAVRRPPSARPAPCVVACRAAARARSAAPRPARRRRRCRRRCCGRACAAGR